MSVTEPSQPIAPLAADAEAERAPAASPAERTEFLNNSIVFAESNIAHSTRNRRSRLRLLSFP
jgi:hypothetical protein